MIDLVDEMDRVDGMDEMDLMGLVRHINRLRGEERREKEMRAHAHRGSFAGFRRHRVAVLREAISE